jgi:hypothetical protein
MAIDRKARKPAMNGLQLRFVRFSGQALMQGAVNMRIGREPIRVYSVAKTVADCLTYRRKVGMNLAVEPRRLQHFAKIRGVEKLLRDVCSSTINMAAKIEI